MAVRTRPILLTAAAAAAGLALFGTVVAQPPSGLPGQPKMSSGSGGTLPATTVRPYSDWSPNPPPGYVQKAPPTQPTGQVTPAGGYQPPPGYLARPVGSAGRPTTPVMAGPGGVQPAGAFDIPPPNLDIPSFRTGPGTGGPLLPPPTLNPEAPDSKFSPTPSAPTSAVAPPTVPTAPPSIPTPTFVPGAAMDAKPAVQPIPTAPTNTLPVPTIPTPTSTNPATPEPPTLKVEPSPLPTFNPTTPTAVQTPPAVAPVAGTLPNKATASVQIEAIGDTTVGFGQEFQYKLVVRNTGSVPVSQVRVDDELPSGARYITSDPPAEQTGEKLVWLLGAMEPGTEKTIVVRAKPTEEGELRSRATVVFAASVDAKTRVTRPRLVVGVNSAETCRAGEETTFQIKVTNGGTGPAHKMILQARLTDGLLHPQGLVIEAELASLPAGESRSIPLKVSAARSGLQSCEIVVIADGSPDTRAKAAVNVVEPMLVVKQTGPEHVLVRAEPNYTIDLSNPGTAATDPVTIHSVLPDGFEFLNASDGGSANGKTVSWKLPSLAAGGSRSVTLKLRAVAASEGSLRTLAQTGAVQPEAGPAPAGGVAVRPASRGLEAKAETIVVSEGVSAVRFEVAALENPIEVGKEAVYEIRVMNQGTGPCMNIQIAAGLDEGLEFIGLGPNSPTQAKVQGQGIIFDPIATLGVKGEAVYRVRIRGSVAGALRMRVQLSCDQLKTPLIKEESTRFYKN